MASFIPRFLRQLRDVDLSGIADGDALVYRASDETFIPGAGGGGGGATNLVDLADVTGTPGTGKAPVSDGAGAFPFTDIATQAELNTETSSRISGDSTAVSTAESYTDSAIAALSGTYQPLDSDLTAIAALTTTSYGRALLALADAAAGRTALGLGTAAVAATGDFDAAGAAAAAQAASQPLDSDLTAIAALTTTSFGRAFLALADAAAGRTALGLGTLATQSGTFSGTSSGTNTGDQTTVSGNAGTATALQTARNIDGQAFDGTAAITVIAPGTHAATSKATPVDADEIPLVDSAASNVLKKVTWANIKATLKTYFDTLYPSGSGTSSGTNTGDQTSVSGNAGTATALQTARAIDGQNFDGTAAITVIAPGTHAATGKTTPVDADEMALVDSAASNVLKKLTWANLKATIKAYTDTLYPSGSGTSSGTNTGDQTISDATITTTDITTNNVSTTKHGFAPKVPNDATKYLDGTGAYSVPGSGAVVLLSTTTLGGDGTFDVSSISQAYNDLILVVIGRLANASTEDAFSMRFNNDSGTNYNSQRIRASGTGVTSAALAATATPEIGGMNANSAAAGAFGRAEIEILGYTSTTWDKTVLSRSGVIASDVYVHTMTWLSTAAINRIQLLGVTTANFKTGSQLRIYGRL